MVGRLDEVVQDAWFQPPPAGATDYWLDDIEVPHKEMGEGE